MKADKARKLLQRLADWFDDPKASPATVVELRGERFAAGYVLRALKTGLTGKLRLRNDKWYDPEREKVPGTRRKPEKRKRCK